MPPPSSEDSLQNISERLHRVLHSKRSLSVALGLGLIALGASLRIGGRHTGPRIRYIPVTQRIASGRIVVKPADRVEFKIAITPEMFNAQVVGNFTAYGGSTNAVAAVLAPEAEYQSWINGNDAKAYYSSDGQKNEDKFAVRLDPGEYSFAISNRLSKRAMKYVYLEVELIYYRAESD